MGYDKEAIDEVDATYLDHDQDYDNCPPGPSGYGCKRKPDWKLVNSLDRVSLLDVGVHGYLHAQAAKACFKAILFKAWLVEYQRCGPHGCEDWRKIQPRGRIH